MKVFISAALCDLCKKASVYMPLLYDSILN